MADDSLGVLGKMGIGTVTNWDDSFPGTINTIGFISESLVDSYSMLENDQLVGSGGMLPPEQGGITVSGTTEHYMNYGDSNTLLAAVLGDDNTTPTPNEITVKDRHGSGSAECFYLEIDKGFTQYRFGPGKPTKITISGEKDGKIKISIDWVFWYVDKVTSGYTGGSFTNHSLVLFEHLEFLLADQADAIASPGDEFNIDSFEFTLDRNMVTDDRASDNAGEPKRVLMPVENGFRDSNLKISLPRYNSNTIVGWKSDHEPLQAKFTFTSTETWIFLLPELRIEDGFDANIGGPEKLTLEGTFGCYPNGGSSPLGADQEIKITYTY